MLSDIAMGMLQEATPNDGNALEVLGRIHNELVTVVTTRK